MSLLESLVTKFKGINAFPKVVNQWHSHLYTQRWADHSHADWMVRGLWLPKPRYTSDLAVSAYLSWTLPSMRHPSAGTMSTYRYGMIGQRSHDWRKEEYWLGYLTSHQSQICYGPMHYVQVCRGGGAICLHSAGND